MDDVQAIEALMLGYAAALDAGDLPAVADLFAHARYGGDDPERFAEGRDAVLATLRATVRLHDDGTPRTKHVTTNIVIEVDDGRDGASGRAYWAVLQATETLPLQVIVAGRYVDRFACVDGGWRFAERRIVTDLVGPVGEHLLVDPARLGLV